MKRSKRRRNGTQVSFCVLLFTLATVVQIGCAPVYRYSYAGHATVVRGSLQGFRTGMTAGEVQAQLGAPDKVFDAEFGAAVGQQWTGTVWLYFLEEDRAFRHVRRYKKAVFVFYPRGENMRLNHWDVES
jgi:hypothetical protein